MKIYHDHAPSFGPHPYAASIQVAILGLCGRGDSEQAARLELLRNARAYQARIDAAIEVIEAEIKANEP